MLHSFQVENYRSLRKIALRLGRVNVITGPNGSGKSNLYHGLQLLAQAVEGNFARAVAADGGLASLMWAGGERGPRHKRQRDAVRLSLAADLDDYSYFFSAGYPSPNSLPLGTIFGDGVEVKEERLTLAQQPSVAMLERKGPSAWLRDAEGRRREYAFQMALQESVVSQLAEPHLYPEIAAVRQQLRAWRFYHQFRTDAESPLRQPCLRVQTTALPPSGEGLASALRTIQEIGEDQLLAQAIDQAFQGGELEVVAERNLARLEIRRPGLLRALSANELSDGQLKFLCLVAALLSPRMPPLLALNEPEASLHPDLTAPLADLIQWASRESQIWLTTHSRPLVAAVSERCAATCHELCLTAGETKLS